MKRSVPAKTATRRSVIFFVGFIATSLLALASACDGGREGDRCNPLQSHDECGKGLSCQQPSTCAENYCCPDPATSSSNPYCNGMGCPPAVSDASVEAEAEAEAEASVSAEGGGG